MIKKIFATQKSSVIKRGIVVPGNLEIKLNMWSAENLHDPYFLGN